MDQVSEKHVLVPESVKCVRQKAVDLEEDANLLDSRYVQEEKLSTHNRSISGQSNSKLSTHSDVITQEGEKRTKDENTFRKHNSTTSSVA